MLVKGEIRKKLKDFFDKQNKDPKNFETGADELADMLEKIIDERIKKATITIPSGQIIVATASGPASNPAPIILNGTIK